MPSCGTISVEEPFQSSNVSIASCSPADATVAPGAQTRVSVRLVNNNPVGATVAVRALVNGATVASETKSVIPNGELSFSIPFTAPTSPGDVSVSTQITSVSGSSTASAPTSSRLTRAFASALDRQRGGLVTVTAPARSTTTATASASASCCGDTRADYIPTGAPGGPVCHAFAAFRQARGR